MKKAQVGFLAEKGASSTMKKGGDGCDGCRSSTSASGNGNETRSARKAAATDDLKKVGEGDAGTSSTDNSSCVAPPSTRVTRSATATAAATTGATAAATTGATAAATTGATAAAVTAARTSAGGDAEADEDGGLAGAAAESKESDREEEVKDGEGGQARSGGGSNRAQRTCRRLALKRIRQYVGYIEEGASTPTAPDSRSVEERSLFKEGRNLTATPSTASTAVRSSTSSRARRGGSVAVETVNAATAGTRHRARTPALPEHSSCSSKHASRSKGEKEAEEDGNVASGCTSPLGRGNGNEDILSCTTPVSKSEAGAAAASAAGTRKEAGADKMSSPNASESPGTVLTGADDSIASVGRSAAPSSGNDAPSCNSGSGGNSSSSGAGCPLWNVEEGVAAAPETAGHGKTACGSSGRPSNGDVASDSGLRVREDGGGPDGAAASPVASTPEPSPVAAGTATRLSAGGVDCALTRRSNTLLRAGSTTDADLRGHCRWQQQQRSAQQHRIEGGKIIVASSDDVAGDDGRALAVGEESVRCEKDALPFSSAPAVADAGMPSPAAATTPPAATTLPSSMFLSAATLAASRPSCATGSVAFPGALVSPTTCSQQHAANLNALMVKSVSPAGVVRRGGRNRRKRTKYDLAYRQMEELGPFAEEAKAVDLSKVSGSSFAVELLKNPDLYSYEAWSHGFAWPVGADGRRLLLRKLRGVYWSDPDYWQQRLMSEGLYRRDLFTLATVQELFKVTHLMGPAVWDFLLKCTALTHKCEALTAKDSDQTDGEDGGGAAAHASSPEALSPNAGPHPVAPSAEVGICTRRVGSSSRGSLLPAAATDHQLYGGQERNVGTSSFPGDSGADGTADSEAAAAAHALAAAAGAVAEDPMDFSSWLRATTGGVTSLGAADPLLGPSTDADGLPPEGVLLMPHTGLACAGTPVREGEEGAVKGGSISRNFFSSSRQKKSFSRCPVPPAPLCESESSGLELDLSTQQMLDAVAAAVEAAAAGQASQQHASQATTLSNRTSTVDAEQAPYLPTNNDIAAVLAAARGFDTGYECPAACAAPTSPIGGCTTSKGTDSLVAADAEPAAPSVAIALSGVATNAGSDTSFEKAVAALREPAEESGTGAQRLSAAAAAAAAADWLGSLQQLLPPVLHAGARVGGGARVDEDTPETAAYGGKAAKPTSAEERTELSCPQYAPLSVLDPARTVPVSSAAGVRMADKLLELLSSPSRDKRSSTKDPAVETERTGKASAQKVADVLGCGGAPRDVVDSTSSLAKMSREETENGEAGSEARQRAQVQRQSSSAEGQEERRDENSKEDGFSAESRSRGGRALPAGVPPRTDTGSGAGGRDTNTQALSHPAFDLLLPPGEEFSVECSSSSDSSRNSGAVAVADRSRYRRDSVFAAGTAAAVPAKAKASGASTLTDDGDSPPCHLALRNMMRLMRATAATAPEAPTAAEKCAPAPGSSRAAAGIESFPEVVRETSLFTSQGEASERKKTSGKKTTSSLEDPQQQEQQSRSVSSLMTTLATALEQHAAPLRIDSGADKSAEGTDAVTDENAQQVISLLQAVNQHLEKQQRKPVTSSFPRPLVSSCVPEASPGSPRATLFGGGGSPCQGLAAQVTDGVSHQTASERLGELRSHGRQEQASSSSHEEFSSGTRCTKCGGCCGEGNSICKECSRKSCPRDQPTKRRTSSSERSAPAFARTFAATSNDAITKANGDFSSARASTQRARRIGEKASLTSALERSLRDGTAALSGEVTGERALSKEERPQIGAGSTGGQDFHLEPGARGAVDVGAGRVGGSFSQKQLDVVLSRSSHHQGETRARHPERQAGSAASHTGAAAAAAELQTPTDLWMRCMQAMGSSLAFLRNCPSRTSESRRRVGSRRSSDAVLAAGGSTVGDVSARADSDACRTAAADARGEDSRNRNRLLPVRTPEAERLGVRRRGRSSRDGSVSLQSRACSSGRPTDGGSEDATNIVFPAQPGEGSGALLLRALRAYSSSAATVAETAPRLWETGSLRRGEEGKATTSDASKSSFGGGVRCSNTSSGSSIPLRGRGSFVRLPASATSSSCWRGAVPDSDGSASSSSAGPACTAAAASSAPSAASLLESTHALLQLKTHYDFMAQFMQCMMLLEVQQALVRLLQSLRRNYPSTHNSRNPSSSSLRRARRMQRRNGRKTQVSFFSSGNDSSCGSSSETGVVDRSLRNSEKFIHNRRRRRRIDAAVNGVPLDACTRLQGGGEAVSPVSRGVGEAEDLQRTSAALCLTIDDRDHQEKAESVADTDKGSMAAAPQPGSTGVACGGEVNKKDGGNSNSVHATSTCSSSAYSSVGRQRRRQSVHRRPRQPGRLDGSAPRREHRSRGSCTAGEQEKGINKSRTNSTSSGRSHSVSSLKCDDGGENVHTNSSSGSSISGNDTNCTDVLWEDEVERSRLRDSSNRSPGDADLHGDPDLSLETFSGRDATMKSCLESLIESLRVQMRFVHVMAGHLQEHMGAAATQERKLEDNSVIRQVEQSFQMGCSREEQQPSASSGSGPPPRDLDTPVATSHSSVGDTQPSSEAAVGSSDATDGGRQTVRRYAGGEESGSPGRCECGDIYYSSGGGGRTSCVRSSSSSGPDFEAAQHAFARDRTGLCERSTPRGDSSTEGRSRRQSCADNSAECRDTPEDRGSQCLKNKDSVSSNAKSDETEWNNAAVGTRAWKKRRLCEGTPGEESVKDGVENLQLSAEKRVRREAHKEAGRCVPATSKDTKTPTRTTEGERAAKFVSGEAESTLPEGTAVSRPGTSGSSYLRDPLVYPTAAGEIRSAALAAGEKVAGESLPGRSVCPTEGKANVSSAVGSSRHGRASFGGARESESYSRTSGSEYNENVFLKCEHEQRQQEILQEFSNGTNESSGSATRNACITQPSNYCPSSSANVRRSNRSGGSGSSRFGTDLGCFKIMEDKEGEGGSDGAPIVDLAASVLTVNSECHVDDAGAANAVQERMNLKADEASETLREKSARLPEPEAGETATEGEKTETKNKKREVAPATVGAGQQQQQQDGRRSTEHDVCG